MSEPAPDGGRTPPRAPVLILTGDDFGASHRVNAAIIRAHRAGVLTAASLMVGAPAAGEAVTLARRHPELRVGLHLVLVDGPAVLPAARLHGLADATGSFPRSPLRQGVAIGLRPAVGPVLLREVQAQFRAFAETGLRLDHVDGHHHLHMHPRVWPLVTAEARRAAAAGIRITREQPMLALRWDRRHLLRRTAHAAALGWLAGGCRRRRRRDGLPCVDRVYGVLEPVTLPYLLWLLQRMPAGDAEVIFHPGAAPTGDPDDVDEETALLCDPAVRQAIAARGFRLGGYADLRVVK